MANFSKPIFMVVVGGALYLAGSLLGGSDDGVIHYDGNDLTMNEAQNEAQRSLPDFLANKLDANGVAVEGAMVKVAFPVTREGVTGDEVIWVGPFGQMGGAFAGLLANQPVDMGGNAGDAVEFTQDMIRDWTYQGADGKLYGNYTTRVMLADMDSGQAAQISQILSTDPVPTRW